MVSLGSSLNMDSNLHRFPSPEAPSHLRDFTAPPSADDLDDLFDYDAGVDHVFRDVDTNMNVPANDQPRPEKRGIETGAGLGIDQEIKVSRKRKPIAKLDEARYGNPQICCGHLRQAFRKLPELTPNTNDSLLSQGGVPKLRRVAKERLKFKGKGHEVECLPVFGLFLV